VNKTQEDRYLSKFDVKKEKEQLRSDNEKFKEENSKLLIDISKVKSRKEVLERELKTQKDDYINKMKILIDKSDNDEKLISALYKEFDKLREMHGTNNPMSGFMEEKNNQNFNMQQEIIKLRQELNEKEKYINNMNSILSGNEFSDKSRDREQLTNLVNRIKNLEEENKKLRRDTEDGQVYESLAKDNAKMRLKIMELEEKMNVKR